MVAHNKLRICEGNKIFQFESAVDVNKCLKQIELTNSQHTCALHSKLPSNIRPMLQQQDRS